MSFPSKTKVRIAAIAIGVSMVSAGCSDIYFDRRETIVPTAGDAMASNRVVMMVDPWPPSSANRNIAMNGEVMQHAVERYRHGRVIPPVNATTSSAAYARASASAANAAQTVRNSTGAPSSSQASGWASSSQPQQQTVQAPASSQTQTQTQAQSQDYDSAPRGETK